MKKWLGVRNQSLKSNSQSVTAAKADNRTLGVINRTLVNRDTGILLKLHLSLMTPKHEYCTQTWRPYLKKDIDFVREGAEESYAFDDYREKG